MIRSVAASMIAFMGRVFFVGQFSGLHRLMFKPGAAIVSARRAGIKIPEQEPLLSLNFIGGDVKH